MICIKYNDLNGVVRINGHAGSAEYGHDLVCAAITALTYTLADAVRDAGADISLEPGNAHVILSRGVSRETGPVFRAICNGYRIIEQEYPMYVHCEKMDSPA